MKTQIHEHLGTITVCVCVCLLYASLSLSVPLSADEVCKLFTNLLLCGFLFVVSFSFHFFMILFLQLHFYSLSFFFPSTPSFCPAALFSFNSLSVWSALFVFPVCVLHSTVSNHGGVSCVELSVIATCLFRCLCVCL